MIWCDVMVCGKLWDMGVKGKMWRVIKGMYEQSKSVVLLEGEKSFRFNVA